MEVLLGFLIATAVGLTGVGGGVLTAPLLILGLGLPAAEAIGTSLLFVTVTKLVATPMYFFRGQVNARTAGLLLVGGIPGAAAGSVLLSMFHKARLEPVVLVAVGATVVLLACLSLYRYFFAAAPAATRRSREHWLPFLALPIGVEVGFSSAGAGALGSLALLECTSLTTASVVGTDLLFGLVVSAAAGALHFAVGNLNAAVLVKLCTGGVLGALTGAWLATRLPAKPLRAGLTVFLIFLGGQLFWRGLSGFVR